MPFHNLTKELIEAGQNCSCFQPAKQFFTVKKLNDSIVVGSTASCDHDTLNRDIVPLKVYLNSPLQKFFSDSVTWFTFGVSFYLSSKPILNECSCDYLYSNNPKELVYRDSLNKLGLELFRFGEIYQFDSSHIKEDADRLNRDVKIKRVKNNASVRVLVDTTGKVKLLSICSGDSVLVNHYLSDYYEPIGLINGEKVSYIKVLDIRESKKMERDRSKIKVNF